jgi:hypothetical protein
MKCECAHLCFYPGISGFVNGSVKYIFVFVDSDEVINASGNPAGKSSQDMENQLFQKATSKEEYLSYVARVILHMREMNDRSMSEAPFSNFASVP